jgi:hypothetical protein
MSIDPAELPNTLEFNTPVKVPTNAHPALASEFYVDNERGLQALTNRTAYLLKHVTGRDPEEAPELLANSGVMRIQKIFGPIGMRFGSPVEGDVALIYWQVVVLGPINLLGLFAYDADSVETPDNVNVIGGPGYYEVPSQPGRWISLWRFTRGVEDGLAPLDDTAKVPSEHLPRNVANGVAGLDGSGKLSPSVMPGLKPVVWGRVKCGLTTPEAGSSGNFTVSYPSGSGKMKIEFDAPISSNYLVFASIQSTDTNTLNGYVTINNISSTNFLLKGGSFGVGSDITDALNTHVHFVAMSA